jgi:ABC-type antimicrobial peptide transport system permease subunit
MARLTFQIMIKNFFTIAIRNIFKHKGFSFINVFGLAVGLAASLLIILWVQDELSFERYNRDAGDIYRVEEDQFYSGDRYHVTVTPFPSGPVWQLKIPEITEQARVHPWLPRTLFRFEDKVFYESSLIAADSTFFRIFSFPLLSGDLSTLLNSPHNIVITEKLAVKYFGKTDPIGKALTVENKYQFMVTGVLKNLSKNSMFTFDIIIPFSFLKEIGVMDNHWGSNSIFTFVRIGKNPDLTAINEKLTKVANENEPQTTTKYMLFPLQYSFIDQDYENQFRTVIRLSGLLKYFTILALIIACLGLYGLASYSAERRTNEVGIRKVMGAGPVTIMYTLTKEFLVFVMIAILISIPLGGFIVNKLLQQFAYRIDMNPLVFAGISAGAIIIAILTVSFQAYRATGINPAEALKVE